MSEFIGSMVTGLVKSTMKNYGTTYTSDIQTPSFCIGTIQYRSPEPSGVFVPGQFRVNGVTMYRDVGSFIPGEITARYIGGGTPDIPQYWWNDTGPIMAENRPWNLPTDPNLQKWAIQEAFAKMNEPRLDVAMMLVELDETLAMLRNPMKALTDLTRKTRLRIGKRTWEYGKESNPNHTLGDALAGSWLTYQYGIYPLMCDVQAIIEKILKGFGDFNRLQTFRGGTHKSAGSSVSGTNYFDAFKIGWRTNISIETKVSAAVYAHGLYRQGLNSSDFGFGADRLLSLAWERIPLSFVVDWFYSVGNFLASVNPTADYSYLGNSVSTKTVYTAKTIALNVTPSAVIGSELLQGDAGEYTRSVEKLQRSVNLPIPGLPVFKLDLLNLRRTISSIALIWQRIPQTWRGR